MWLIENLGSVSAFIVIIFVMILLIPVLRICKRCNAIRKFTDVLSRYMYWSAVIHLITQEYVLLSLCCMVNIIHLKWNKWSSFLSSSLAIFVMSLLLTYPFLLIYILKRYFKQLQNKNFREKFGAAYENLSTTHGANILIYPIFFFGRRVILSASVVYTSTHLIV